MLATGDQRSGLETLLQKTNMPKLTTASVDNVCTRNGNLATEKLGWHPSRSGNESEFGPGSEFRIHRQNGPGGPSTRQVQGGVAGAVGGVRRPGQ